MLETFPKIVVHTLVAARAPVYGAVAFSLTGKTNTNVLPVILVSRCNMEYQGDGNYHERASSQSPERCVGVKNLRAVGSGSVDYVGEIYLRPQAC